MSTDANQPTVGDGGAGQIFEKDSTLMGRRKMLAMTGAAVATVAVGAGGASASISNELNFNSDLTHNPEQEATYTIAENSSSMTSPLGFIDDNGNLDSLADYGGIIDPGEDDEPHNPITLRADRIDAGDYSAFPVGETRELADDEEEDLSALDAEEWTEDAEITLEDISSEAGSNALSVTTDGIADAASASMAFNVVDITSGVDRKFIQAVANVISIDAGVEVAVVVSDDAGNSKQATIVDAEGYGQVTQERVGELDGDDLENIDTVEVEVTDGDADFELVGLNLERESRWEFGEEEYKDEEDEIDTQTIYEPSGEFSITSLQSLGDQFSDEKIVDLDVEVLFRTSEMPADQVDYEITEAERYSEDNRKRKIISFDLPTAYDLSPDLGDLVDEVRHPSGRYIQVGVSTGEEGTVTLEDEDDDDVEWTYRSGDYGSIGNDVVLTSNSASGETTAVFYDLLLTSDEADEITDTSAAPGAGPTGTSGDGILGFFMSVPGVMLSAVTGWGVMRWIRSRGP